jgi:hypothetical protein
MLTQAPRQGNEVLTESKTLPACVRNRTTLRPGP